MVTVCIPTYNRPDLLRQSLQSVLWQSFADFEVIVSDNGSQTDTAAVIAEFGDPRVKLDRLDENIGLYRNLSRALRLGTGKYRMMLPDDDLMLPGNLERKVRFFEAHPNVGLVHSAFRYLNADGLPNGPVTKWTPHEVDTVQPGKDFVGLSLAQGGVVCVSSVLLRSDLVADEIFDEADGPYCDLALWMRVAMKGDVGFLAEGLSGYRVHVSSASSGFRLVEKKGRRHVLTLQHADALHVAYGRFIARQDIDPELAAEFGKLHADSDRRMRLSIRINRLLPRPVIGLIKRVLRLTRGNKMYEAVSLYSAYAPDVVDEGTAEPSAEQRRD